MTYSGSGGGDLYHETHKIHETIQNEPSLEVSDSRVVCSSKNAVFAPKMCQLKAREQKRTRLRHAFKSSFVYSVCFVVKLLSSERQRNSAVFFQATAFFARSTASAQSPIAFPSSGASAITRMMGSVLLARTWTQRSGQSSRKPSPSVAVADP